MFFESVALLAVLALGPAEGTVQSVSAPSPKPPVVFILKAGWLSVQPKSRMTYPFKPSPNRIGPVGNLRLARGAWSVAADGDWQRGSFSGGLEIAMDAFGGSGIRFGTVITGRLTQRFFPLLDGDVYTVETREHAEFGALGMDMGVGERSGSHWRVGLLVGMNRERIGVGLQPQGMPLDIARASSMVGGPTFRLIREGPTWTWDISSAVFWMPSGNRPPLETPIALQGSLDITRRIRGPLWIGARAHGSNVRSGFSPYGTNVGIVLQVRP